LDFSTPTESKIGKHTRIDPFPAITLPVPFLPTLWEDPNWAINDASGGAMHPRGMMD
jgi:hypothetical protein